MMPNAKLEILNMQYKNLQVGKIHNALHVLPQDLQEQALES